MRLLKRLSGAAVVAHILTSEQCREEEHGLFTRMACTFFLFDKKKERRKEWLKHVSKEEERLFGKVGYAMSGTIPGKEKFHPSLCGAGVTSQ